MRRLTSRWLADWTPLVAIIAAYHLGGVVSRAMARPRAGGLLTHWDVLLFGTNPGYELQLQTIPAERGGGGLF